jgi:hypothetical protein
MIRFFASGDHTVARDVSAMSPARLAAVALLALSVGLACWPVVVIEEFSYRHSWVAAHFATMARSFLDHGVLELGLVPVQNSGPLTDEPDYYLHWPPFFAIFQAWIFALFGTASVFAVHALSTALVLAQAALIGMWLRRVVSPLAAFAAVVVFLNLPVMAKFGHIGLYLHLALLLALAAVLLHDYAARRDTSHPGLTLVGAACFALACFTSWEPILVLPGLAIYWLIDRSWRRFRLFAIYAASGAASVAATLSLYFLQFPDVIIALMDRALYRAGLSNYAVSSVQALHTLESNAFDVHEHDFGFLALKYLSGILFGHLPQLGLIGGLCLIAVAVLCVRPQQRPWSLPGPILVLAPLLSMGVLWIVLMAQHFYIHEFQALLFAIPAALAAGFMAQAKHASLMASDTFAAAVVAQPKSLLIALGAIAIAGRLGADIGKYVAYDPDGPLIEIGKTLARTVPEDSVVAVPWKTMVPTYYSDRHLIRGVETYDAFLRYAEQIKDLCAECPVYLVLPAGHAAASGSRYPVLWEDGHWQLLMIRDRQVDPS